MGRRFGFTVVVPSLRSSHMFLQSMHARKLRIIGKPWCLRASWNLQRGSGIRTLPDKPAVRRMSQSERNRQQDIYNKYQQVYTIYNTNRLGSMRILLSSTIQRVVYRPSCRDHPRIETLWCLDTTLSGFAVTYPSDPWHASRVVGDSGDGALTRALMARRLQVDGGGI